MDETSTLGFDIRARILPQIEGTQELEQSLKNIPNQISQPIGEIVNSSGFQQGLTPQQVQEIPAWMKYNQGIFDDLNSSIKEILEDINVDLSTGKLSKGQTDKYIRKFERLKLGAGSAGEDLVGDASDFLKLDKDHLDMIRAAIQDSKGDIGNDIDFLKEKLRDIAKGFKDTGNDAQSFYDTLKKAGVFTVGMEGANSIISYIRTGAEIQARGMTAFDLSSPMGMYSEQQRQETFSAVKDRERIYQMVGTAIGIGVGAIFGGGIGGAAGGAAGGMFGSQIAGIMGITQTAGTEEQLKYMNQMFGTFSGAVGSASNYDILRARLRARLGRGAQGSLGFGYAPEEEMQMRMGFADTLGRFDPELYREQTTFATAHGLSPQEIYQLNLSGRVTGANYGVGGLRQGEQMARELYGPGVNPERIVDVLNSIKAINEKQLQLNINADARNGGLIANIPELLFGNKSPYGRISDLGGTTISNLQDMMNPHSDAQLAFLFQAMGTNDITKFNEMMKGGTFAGNNFSKILDQVKRDTGGSQNMAYWELNGMMPNAPEGMLPEIAQIMTGGKYITRNKTDQEGNLVLDKNKKPITESVFMTLDRFKEEMERQQKAISDSNLTEEEKTKRLKESQEVLLGWTNEARNAKSETEKMMAEIRAKQNQIADAWRTLVFKMQNDWLEVFKKISGDSEDRQKLNKQFIDAERQAISYFEKILNQHGIETPEGRASRTSAFNNMFGFNGIHIDPRDRNSAVIRNWGGNKGGEDPLSEQFTKLNTVMENVNTVMTKLNDNLDKGIKVVVPIYSNGNIDSPIHHLQNSFSH